VTTDPFGAAPAPIRRRGLTIGVRARILATVLVLAGLGLGVAGALSIAVERRQMLDHIDASLQVDVAEFRTFASDPAVIGAPGTDVAAILRTALERQAITTHEVVLGMINGKPAFVTPGRRPFAIEAERRLIAEIAAIPASAPTSIRESETSIGTIRYAAVQVRVAGRPERGTLVVAASLRPVHQAFVRSIRQYVLLSAAALVLIGLGGWLVAGRLLRPLALLRQGAERISHTDLTARIPVTGNDDVTELTRTVNTMLDRIQGAFDAQQRFLDDAGHELRTPLTIVRGHLEVLDVADPSEVAATRDLVMDELDRMSRLVSDLIVLAQAGRPDFVRLEPVDLDRLLRDVLDKAQALADRHWVLDGSLEVTALADPQRITQAMLQLAHNAVKHTAVDDVIAVGGVQTGGRILLWVRDTGSGVSEADAARIFERFGRSGTVRGDGSGLGLSIVSGIATAHGGRVTLDQPRDGGGARFSLVLPLFVLPRNAAGVMTHLGAQEEQDHRRPGSGRERRWPSRVGAPP
jgi:signal transduction histidine kinase